MDATAPPTPGFAVTARSPLRAPVKAPPDGAKFGLALTNRGAALLPSQRFRPPLQVRPQLAAPRVARGRAAVGRLAGSGVPLAGCILEALIRVRAPIRLAPLVLHQQACRAPRLHLHRPSQHD